VTEIERSCGFVFDLLHGDTFTRLEAGMDPKRSHDAVASIRGGPARAIRMAALACVLGLLTTG